MGRARWARLAAWVREETQAGLWDTPRPWTPSGPVTTRSSGSSSFQRRTCMSGDAARLCSSWGFGRHVPLAQAEEGYVRSPESALLPRLLSCFLAFRPPHGACSLRPCPSERYALWSSRLLREAARLNLRRRPVHGS